MTSYAYEQMLKQHREEHGYDDTIKNPKKKPFSEEEVTKAAKEFHGKTPEPTFGYISLTKEEAWKATEILLDRTETTKMDLRFWEANEKTLSLAKFSGRVLVVTIDNTIEMVTWNPDKKYWSPDIGGMSLRDVSIKYFALPIEKGLIK